MLTYLYFIMALNSSGHLNQALARLETMTIQFSLERFLEQTGKSLKAEPRIDHYNGVFSKFQLKKRVQSSLSAKNKNFNDLISLRDVNADINDLANEIVEYLHQGLEMLRTSLLMPEKTAPLLEYYGFLQCVKAYILVDLKVDDGIYFINHGLAIKQPLEEGDLSYIRAKIMVHGVFPVLLIRSGNVKDLDHFYKQDYFPNLEEILYNMNTKTNHPAYVFLGMWMLSMLVRYHPIKWREILDGKKNAILDDIRTFRRVQFPQTLSNMLGHDSSHKSKSYYE